MALRELNCGVYCFDADWLWRRLVDVPVTPPKGEHYLTDTIGLAVEDGLPVEVVTITDVSEVQGINTRVHLARSERILRDRINERLMLEGVTLKDPATTYIEATVQVGRDTLIEPNTYLRGKTVVGERCTIGPNAILRDTCVMNDCVVLASVMDGATLEDGVGVGPYARLRPGAHLAEGVHMGSFGEVKNSYLAPGTFMGHFGYIGDATVGKDVNIAAGTITCNFDGKQKQRTTIEDGAFIGSGTLLVAPTRIGAGAETGAGSVVTHELPPGCLAYGVPARVKRRRDGDEEATTDGS
jgi:bifunctional UDP-N-acetylglucosamine pyrophosphorylase/glucosamine-1-phosphate N-acetyltransferase